MKQGIRDFSPLCSRLLGDKFCLFWYFFLSVFFLLGRGGKTIKTKTKLVSKEKQRRPLAKILSLSKLHSGSSESSSWWCLMMPQSWLINTANPHKISTIDFVNLTSPHHSKTFEQTLAQALYARAYPYWINPPLIMFLLRKAQGCQKTASTCIYGSCVLVSAEGPNSNKGWLTIYPVIHLSISTAWTIIKASYCLLCLHLFKEKSEEQSDHTTLSSQWYFSRKMMQLELLQSNICRNLHKIKLLCN